MTTKRPHLIVIAGPNGATAPSLLKGTLHVTEFVSADLITQRFSVFKLPSEEFAINRVAERVRFDYCYAV